MSPPRWRSRGSYGKMMHKTIKNLQQRFDGESDLGKSVALAKTIGYLVSVQASLIKDEENSFLEGRVEELEMRLGIK
ncbi:hypothetical protein [Candidatus Nitrosotenuis aquarius]|uniref:hypothetical protein n=1 Tax=Candidatus Nitrosotenuis aquarius TaxID=1846278 RepID=UPI0013C2AB23|nr:hypothetical protein [Candidatus Nitrosotenuis aquarius]